MNKNPDNLILSDDDEKYFNELSLRFRIDEQNKVISGNKNCLSCRVSFKSEGKHNRLCLQCRKDNGFNE